MANVPRLLIVSAFFPPSRKIGARRPERFARHLAQRGWDVTVLTLRERYGHPLDDGWTPPPGVHVIRTHAFMPGNVLRLFATGLRRLRADGSRTPDNSGNVEQRDGSPLQTTGPIANGAFPSLRAAFLRKLSRAEFPDRWIGWKPFALAAVARCRFDVVLGTLPPYSSALLAQRIAHRDQAVLALDYRDPWTEAARVGWDPALYAHLLDRHRRVEDDCLRSADVIFATSPTICRWLAPRAGIEPVFAPNSFDERRDPIPTRANSRTIVYTGSLAYGRSLSPVLSAMSRVSAGEENGLELVYAGSDGESLRADADRLGMSRRVRDLGYLPAEDSKRLLRQALAAVVLVTPGYEYMLPGKMFEVVASGTPLLLVAPEDSDVAAICRAHRLGWHHVPNDVEGIARSLRQAMTGELPLPIGLETLRTDHVVDVVATTLRDALATSARRG